MRQCRRSIAQDNPTPLPCERRGGIFLRPGPWAWIGGKICLTKDCVPFLRSLTAPGFDDARNILRHPLRNLGVVVRQALPCLCCVGKRGTLRHMNMEAPVDISLAQKYTQYEPILKTGGTLKASPAGQTLRSSGRSIQSLSDTGKSHPGRSLGYPSGGTPGESGRRDGTHP